ncbi:MAG: thiamine pyrophosphate-binding protein [Candidatus Tectomicrobia bacterium]|nr:thiamine pyrophosphate-binding protein [Candidatus Tectomicrobia bacterium]
MSQMTGGQAVVRSLVREGVEIVFGLPGVQVMGIFDAFYEQPDIRLITVRHEQTTTYMADGYARVRGKPGVALVVPGPGIQNASAGLGTAYAVSSPILLVAGQVESYMLGLDKGALHEINDQIDLVRPITKWCKRVLRVEEIPDAIHEAMRQMKTGRPRPTEVEVPPDVLASTAEVELLELEEYPSATPDREQIRRAADLLLSSQKPLIWAGGGVILADASRELVTLAEALGIPVATTAEGKGAIPEDHPLSLGVGYYGQGAPSWASPKADVILAVGTRFTSQMSGPTKLQSPQQLIHIDADPTVIGKNYPAEVAIVADAGAALKALIEEIRGKGKPKDRWVSAELDECRRNHQQRLQEYAPLQCEIIAQIQNALGDDAIIVSGITNIGYWSHLAYRVRQPRTYLTASYFATLGFAFPTALGAKMAAPDRPVISISGDGGFMYALPELSTAVKYGINVIALVFVDGAFGASINDQRTRYQGRVVGTELHNPSFAQIAEVFGAKGIKVGPENVGRALQEALEANRPTVIEVPIPTLTPPFQIPMR